MFFIMTLLWGVAIELKLPPALADTPSANVLQALPHRPLPSKSAYPIRHYPPTHASRFSIFSKQLLFLCQGHVPLLAPLGLVPAGQEVFLAVSIFQPYADFFQGTLRLEHFLVLLALCASHRVLIVPWNGWGPVLDEYSCQHFEPLNGFLDTTMGLVHLRFLLLNLLDFPSIVLGHRSSCFFFGEEMSKEMRHQHTLLVLPVRLSTPLLLVQRSMIIEDTFTWPHMEAYTFGPEYVDMLESLLNHKCTTENPQLNTLLLLIPNTHQPLLP